MIVDRMDELWDAVEAARANPLLNQLTEPELHHVEPRGTGRNEVELKPGMLF